MIEIGKGETQTIIFRLLPQESGVLSVDDTISFSVGSGIGPETLAPVRNTASIIIAAELSIKL